MKLLQSVGTFFSEKKHLYPTNKRMKEAYDYNRRRAGEIDRWGTRHKLLTLNVRNVESPLTEEEWQSVGKRQDGESIKIIRE